MGRLSNTRIAILSYALTFQLFRRSRAFVRFKSCINSVAKGCQGRGASGNGRDGSSEGDEESSRSSSNVVLESEEKSSVEGITVDSSRKNVRLAKCIGPSI